MMNLTTILLFVVTLAFIQVIAEPNDEPTKASLDEWSQQCITETEVDVQLLEDEELDAYIDDSKVKCYHACMMKKIGFMSADGIVDKEKMNNYMPSEIPENRKNQLKELRQKCIEMTGKNECETIFLIRNCIRRQFKIRSGPYDHTPNIKLSKLILECRKETGADPNLINISIRGGEISNSAVQCWHACLDKKLKFMSADNVVNKTRITNFFRTYIPKEDRETVRQYHAKCAELVGENECETSQRIYSCLQKELMNFNKAKRTSPNGQSSKNAEECQSETGADPALIQALWKNEMVDDQKIKCFLACMYKRTGKMSEDGEVYKHNIINSFVSTLSTVGIRGILRQPISECVEKTGKDDCETAYLISSCAASAMKNFNEMYKNRPIRRKPRLTACAANVDPEYLAAEEIDNVARDPGVKCYYACVYKKFNYMLEDGTVMKQVILDQMPLHYPMYKRQIMNLEQLTKCVELSGEDKCDTAFLIEQCIDSFIEQIKSQMHLVCQNRSRVNSENSEFKNGSKNIDNLKCYHACMFEEHGWMTEDGTVMKAEIIIHNSAMAPQKRKNQVQQLLAGCTELTGEDKCDTAALIYNCVNSIVKELQKGRRT